MLILVLQTPQTLVPPYRKNSSCRIRYPSRAGEPRISVSPHSNSTLSQQDKTKCEEESRRTLSTHGTLSFGGFLLDPLDNTVLNFD